MTQCTFCTLSSFVSTAYCARLSRPLFSEFCFPLAQRQLGGLRHLSLKASETAPSTSVLEAIMGMDALQSLELLLPGLNIPFEIILRKKRTGVVLQNLRSLSLDLFGIDYIQPLGLEYRCAKWCILFFRSSCLLGRYSSSCDLFRV